MQSHEPVPVPSDRAASSDRADARGSTGARAARVGLAFAAGALLLGASPARAGGEFEDGFEDQLGRIAAVEVVRFGKAILFGGLDPYAHRGRVRRAGPPPRIVHRHHDPYPRTRIVRYRGRRHVYVDPYDEPCVDRHHTDRPHYHDRDGRVVYERYERHEYDGRETHVYESERRTRYDDEPERDDFWY